MDGNRIAVCQALSDPRQLSKIEIPASASDIFEGQKVVRLLKVFISVFHLGHPIVFVYFKGSYSPP